jgi:KTSC domain
MIRSVGYDHISSILEIEFHSGKVYRYFGVPQQTHIELMSAGSKGGYFEAYIKSVGYSYQRSL